MLIVAYISIIIIIKCIIAISMSLLRLDNRDNDNCRVALYIIERSALFGTNTSTVLIGSVKVLAHQKLDKE